MLTVPSTGKSLLTTIIKDNLFEQTGLDSWPSPNAAAEAFLKKYGAEKWPDGSDLSTNYNRYTVSTKSGDNKPRENYVFEEDNQVYAMLSRTELHWSYKNTVFNLYIDKERKSFHGQIKINPKLDNDSFSFFNKDGEVSITNKDDGPGGGFWTVNNIGHTVLDIFGFVPFWGDIGDVINTIWYLYDKRYFDAALSAIAIIPIIGTPIKYSLKGASKLWKSIMKGMGAFKNPKKIAEFWRGVYISKFLDTKDIAKLGKGFSETANYLSTPALRKRLPADYLRVVDELEFFLRTSGRSLDDLAAASKTLATTKPLKTFAIPHILGTAKQVENIKWYSKLINPLTWRLPFTKLLKSGKVFKPQKVEAIAKMMEKTYRKSLDKQPAKLFALMSTSAHYRKLGVPTDYYKHLQKLKTTNPGAYSKEVDEIFNQAIKENNIFWEMYKRNDLAQLSAGLNPRLMQKELRGMAADFRKVKKVDVVWNELSSILEDMGVREDDRQDQAIFYPLAAAAINNYWPAGATVAEQLGSYGRMISGLVKKLYYTSMISLGIIEEEDIYAATEEWTPDDIDQDKYDDYYEYVDSQNSVNEDLTPEQEKSAKDGIPLIYAMTPGVSKKSKLNWTLSNISDPKVQKIANIIFSTKEKEKKVPK